MATQSHSDAAWAAYSPSGASPVPSSNGEYITLLAHYYRGELARMAGWRTRIDLTSNWAITVAGAMLSISLSTPTAHHGVVLLAMLLVTLLWTIEARRYRFFDVYRSRIRGLERHLFAQTFAPDPEENSEWLRQLAADLRKPSFHLTRQQALSRRLRRNYGWMYLVLLLAWLLKTCSSDRSQDGPSQLVSSVPEWVAHCQLAILPGPVVIVVIAAFYGWLLFIGLRFWFQDLGDRREYGEVYV
jgi:uncharacterized membrane protein